MFRATDAGFLKAVKSASLQGKVGGVNQDHHFALQHDLTAVLGILYRTCEAAANVVRINHL
ncbi:MAG: hypothetical protein JKY27_03570 [Magnetovibrio sp.]|nr:hypothetical protein [Magnetovibrio sp.]